MTWTWSIWPHDWWATNFISLILLFTSARFIHEVDAVKIALLSLPSSLWILKFSVSLLSVFCKLTKLSNCLLTYFILTLYLGTCMWERRWRAIGRKRDGLSSCHLTGSPFTSALLALQAKASMCDLIVPKIFCCKFFARLWIWKAS